MIGPGFAPREPRGGAWDPNCYSVVIQTREAVLHHPLMLSRVVPGEWQSPAQSNTDSVWFIVLD